MGTKKIISKWKLLTIKVQLLLIHLRFASHTLIKRRFFVFSVTQDYFMLKFYIN